MGGLITVGSCFLVSAFIFSSLFARQFCRVSRKQRVGVWEFSCHQASKDACKLYLHSRNFQKPTGVLDSLHQGPGVVAQLGSARRKERESCMAGKGQWFVSCCIPCLQGFRFFSGMAFRGGQRPRNVSSGSGVYLRTQKGQRPLSLSVRFLCSLHSRGILLLLHFPHRS